MKKENSAAILKLLQRRRLYWGATFFCAGMHVGSAGVRTRAATMCVRKNEWVRFSARRNRIHLEVLAFPPRGSGYPHAEFDLNPVDRFQRIEVREDDHSKGILFHLTRGRVLLLRLDSSRPGPALCFTENRADIARFRE